MAIATKTTGKELSEYPRPPYEKVWFSLLVLTIIEVLVGSQGFVELFTKSFQILVLIILAITKAALVGAYFMHIKFERHPLWVTFLTFGFPILLGGPIALVALFD